jgi:hypothetical protein
MSDGVIAAKANQRIAGLHGLSHPLLDEVPWIQGAVELDIAMTFEPASRTDVNSRFAPRTIGVGKQFTANKRRCLAYPLLNFS